MLAHAENGYRPLGKILGAFGAGDDKRAAAVRFQCAVKQTQGIADIARRLMIRETEDLLERLGMADRGHKPAGALSYGDRRRLEVGLALACQPDLLLLDEPTSGMSSSDKPALVRLIQSVVKERGVTTVLIEHDMDLVFSVSDRITVMHQGAVLAEGRPAEIQTNARVQEVYLGAEQHA